LGVVELVTAEDGAEISTPSLVALPVLALPLLALSTPTPCVEGSWESLNGFALLAEDAVRLRVPPPACEPLEPMRANVPIANAAPRTLPQADLTLLLLVLLDATEGTRSKLEGA